MQSFDVVIVPDFGGRARATFEARTLYFLASWLEFAGVSREFPLHVACIGEPPRSVRELAAKARARISQHTSMGDSLGVFANKLRGFDAPLETEHLFLLDVDVFVLDDLAPLARTIPDDAIAATHSHSAIILGDMWEELYAAVGLTPPPRTMKDFHVALDDGVATADALYPSYSSGAIFAPRRARLRERWLEHLHVLTRFRDRWTPRLAPRNMLVGDEPALATAVRSLAGEGQDIVLMPDRFHGKWRHLYRRAPRLREFALFHMSSSFSAGSTLEEKIDPGSLAYERKLLRRYVKRWLLHGRGRAREAATHLGPAIAELAELSAIYRRLYRNHVQAVLPRSSHAA